MIPIGDDNYDRHITPIVNYALIALNFFVFIYLQGTGVDYHFTYAFSTVPAEILTGHDIVTNPQILQDQLTGQEMEIPGLQPTPGPVYFTLLTSMFMHGGWAHLLGNMLYLWVFGDNIEQRLGHGKYIIFYLVCGVIASLSHVFITAYLSRNMLIPSLGASGAISGVLGAYILLFPTRKVQMLTGFFVIGVPAIVSLGIWIIFQVISGLGMLGGSEDGVAYGAHIGGFIGGLILVKFFDNGDRTIARNKRRFSASRWI